MPFEATSTPDFRCIWLEGPPNSGKSYSLRTAPKKVGVISVPGEKGHSSLPYGDGYVCQIWKDEWEIDANGKTIKGVHPKDRYGLYYMQVARDIENVTIDLISGKYGKLETIVIDGAHKLYATYLAAATDGESERLQSAFKRNEQGKLEGDFDPRCYGKAHRLMWEFVNMVASSRVPWRIFTSWSEMEKDDPDDTSKNATKHLLPDLPGKAARRVLGEVSVTLHATISADGKFIWQTKPGGKVAGAGIKGPAEIVSKVPSVIPQDFEVLAKYLDGGTKAA